MRCLYWAIALLILLPTVQYGLSSFELPAEACKAPSATEFRAPDSLNDSGDCFPLVMISAVMPAFVAEYIGLYNPGDQVQSLKGWTISDQEGTLTFIQDISLAPGEELLVASDLALVQRLVPDANVLCYASESILKKGRFQLADEGDEVLLFDKLGLCCDAVVMGKSEYAGIGWQGRPCAKVPEGQELRRSLGPLMDTNGSIDWHLTVPGRSAMTSSVATGRVEPFLSPVQMRGRIFRELEFAQATVKAAVYELTDDVIAQALCGCADRGVKVQVLLEGMPVGGILEAEGRAIRALQDSKCDVLLLKAFNGYKRYAYMHAKYLVVDGRRTLITSENWATSSFDGNRGWGVVIDSAPVASWYQGVFDADFDHDRLDAYPPPLYNSRNSSSSPALPSAEEMIESYAAEVRTVISPDFSLSAVSSLLASARERILLELFYWEDRSDVLSLRRELLEAAERGVEVRVLFDGSWYNQEGGNGNRAVAELLNLEASTHGLNLEARVCSAYHDFTTIHNKGAIVDDYSLVSSINWGLSAFNENREVAIVIHSSEVAGRFSTAFFDDWVNDSEPPVIRISPMNGTYFEGQRVIIDSSNSSDDAGIAGTFWDLQDDGSIDWRGSVLVCRLPSGHSPIRLTVVDINNNSASTLLWVEVEPKDDEGIDVPWEMALAAIPIAIIWKGLKRVNRR